MNTPTGKRVGDFPAEATFFKMLDGSFVVEFRVDGDFLHDMTITQTGPFKDWWSWIETSEAVETNYSNGVNPLELPTMKRKGVRDKAYRAYCNRDDRQPCEVEGASTFQVRKTEEQAREDLFAHLQHHRGIF